MWFHLIKFLLLIPLVSGSAIRREASEDAPGTYLTSAEGALTGELRKWHKITLGFEGPLTSERASPNPFIFYRLDVTFRHDESGKEYLVPGYYAATGDAAHTSADSGNAFLVHFSPDEVGVWEWTASFVKGNWIVAKSIEDGTSAGFFDGQTGQFEILPTDKEGRDLRGKGRLQYVHQHHMQFAETKEWFFQAGADAPENFLAYEDFDNTPNYGGYRKSWAPHIPDFNDGDPTWADGKGTGIIGAINYLSEQGMNSVSMLTFNVDGDDRNVFFFRNPSNFKRLDCSKLAQWEIVLEHADKMGLHLHFKTQEHENDQLMNGGRLGKVRKLYYRELIARFGHHVSSKCIAPFLAGKGVSLFSPFLPLLRLSFVHLKLALTYNLGEENTNLSGRLRKFANYFEENDPYNTLVVVHTYPDQKELVYTPQLGVESFDGASLQSSPVNVYDETLEWIQKSADSGHPWVVTVSDAIAHRPCGIGACRVTLYSYAFNFSRHTFALSIFRMMSRTRRVLASSLMLTTRLTLRFAETYCGEIWPQAAAV